MSVLTGITGPAFTYKQHTLDVQLSSLLPYIFYIFVFSLQWLLVLCHDSLSTVAFPIKMLPLFKHSVQLFEVCLCSFFAFIWKPEVDMHLLISFTLFSFDFVFSVSLEMKTLSWKKTVNSSQGNKIHKLEYQENS